MLVLWWATRKERYYACSVYQAFSVIVGVWVCPSVRPQSVTRYAHSEYDHPPDYRRFVVAWFPQERTDGCFLEALAAAVAVPQI